MSKFLALKFSEDGINKYSVVKSTLLVDGTKRNCPNGLEGSLELIQWGKKQVSATIVNVGSKRDMEAFVDKVTENELYCQENEDADPQILDNEEDPETATVDEKSDVEIPTDLLAAVSEKYARLKSKYKRLKLDHKSLIEVVESSDRKLTRLSKKYKRVKNKCRQLRTERVGIKEASNNDVELVTNSGVVVNRSVLSNMVTLSTSAPCLARSLFRHLFSNEEVQGHSLLGKRCSANGKEVVPLPPVDSNRRDAIIAFAVKKFTPDLAPGVPRKILEVKQHSNAQKREQRAITKSLSDLVREMNRRPLQ